MAFEMDTGDFGEVGESGEYLGRLDEEYQGEYHLSVLFLSFLYMRDIETLFDTEPDKQPN